MSSSFLTYQKFFFLREAEELQELLLLHDVVCIIDDDAPSFDPSFANNQFSREFKVKVKAADFEKADAILSEQFEITSEEIDENYHLLKSTDFELFDILEKPDQWSRFEFFMARKILAHRGLPIDEETINNIIKKRMSALSIPKRASMGQLYKGYILVVIGGILGLMQGLTLLGHKLLPNGQQIKEYDNWSRTHGMIMLVLGAVVFMGLIFWFVQWRQ